MRRPKKCEKWWSQVHGVCLSVVVKGDKNCITVSVHKCKNGGTDEHEQLSRDPPTGSRFISSNREWALVAAIGPLLLGHALMTELKRKRSGLQVSSP